MTLDAMPRSQLALRALVLLGPVVALLATGPAGHGPPWWLVGIVTVLAAAAAVAPDSPVGAGAGGRMLADSVRRHEYPDGPEWQVGVISAQERGDR